VPWGKPELDRQIRHTMSEGLALDFWLLRSCYDTEFPAYPLWLTLDVSLLFDAGDTKDIVREMANLPLLPQPSELVVVLPPVDSINTAVLDEVAMRLDPIVSWLYVPEDQVAHASSVIERCATAWGVRATS
jgi:hypothetical protein